jgi:hypothetical protein
MFGIWKRPSVYPSEPPKFERRETTKIILQLDSRLETGRGPVEFVPWDSSAAVDALQKMFPAGTNQTILGFEIDGTGIKAYYTTDPEKTEASEAGTSGTTEQHSGLVE